MNVFPKKAKLFQLGKFAFVDPKIVSAIYKDKGQMVIRMDGLGIIRFNSCDLFSKVDDSILILAQEVEG